MHLRTSLVAVAVIVTASVVGMTAAAGAMTLRINSDITSGSSAVDGVFVSGTASIAGSTYSCAAGNLAGIAGRGTNPIPTGINLTTLNLSCNTPLGNGTISLNSCTVPVDFSGISSIAGWAATDLVVDTWVPGVVNFGTGTCVKVSTLSGFCTANVQGSVVATFDETVRNVGGVNYQDLVVHGLGTLANQSAGCFSTMTGTIALNNIKFHFEKTGGTTQGLDFGS